MEEDITDDEIEIASREENNVENPISVLVKAKEEELNSANKRIKYLEKLIQVRNTTIRNLKSSLEFQQLKFGVAIGLLENSGVDFTKYWKEAKDGVHVYTEKIPSLSVIIHEHFGEENFTVGKGKRKPKIIRGIPLEEENPTEQEEKLKKAEEDRKELIQEYCLDVSITDVLKIIEGKFSQIEIEKIPKKSILEIRRERTKLLGSMKLDEYIAMIVSHIRRLENLLLRKKNYNDTKNMITLISTGLSPLEQRLVSYGKYYTTIIEPDDLQKFKIALKVNMEHPARYIPFSLSELLKKILNYSLALCPISEVLKITLKNPFNNIVYVPLEKSDKKDPHSFYILEKVVSGKRHWKLECRLDDFSKILAEKIRIYCTEKFRKIYLDSFSDNLYRPDYTQMVVIGGYDCAQLNENILCTCRRKSFCKMVQEIVMENCTFHPTELDKFNFQADDKANKKAFSLEKDEPEYLKEGVTSLFDNLKEEELQKLIL